MPKQAAIDLMLLQREKDVARLYLRHCTQREIAVELSVSQATVSLTLKRLKEIWQEECRMDRQERIEEDLAALDALDRQSAEAMAEKGLSPVAQQQWAHIRIKLMERRSKLLGLDAETRLAISGGVEQERCAVRLRLGNNGHDGGNGNGSDPITKPDRLIAGNDSGPNMG